MKFEELCNLMMEIPHGEFDNPIEVYDFSHRVKQITYVDYKIELWEIPFELKSGFFGILSTLNDIGTILIVRHTSSSPSITIIDKNKEEQDAHTPDILDLLDKNGIEWEDFETYIPLNAEHFIYYDENFNEVFL